VTKIGTVNGAPTKRHSEECPTKRIFHPHPTLSHKGRGGKDSEANANQKSKVKNQKSKMRKSKIPKVKLSFDTPDEILPLHFVRDDKK
jgi:hypothetical protein